MDRSFCCNALVCSMLAILHPTAIAGQPEKQDMEAKAKKLLNELLTPPTGGVSIDNSRVVITSKLINRLTQEGLGNLDILINAMKDSTISFDAFVRCYSACDQILRKVDPEIVVYWIGGCRIVDVDGVWQLF